MGVDFYRCLYCHSCYHSIHELDLCIWGEAAALRSIRAERPPGFKPVCQLGQMFESPGAKIKQRVTAARRAATRSFSAGGRGFPRPREMG